MAAIFLINVPIGVSAIVVAVRYLPADAARASRGIDVAGVVLLSFSLLLVVVPLSVGRAEGWPVWAWLCLTASVPAFAAFVAAQRRIADRDGSPLVNVRVLADRQVFWALATLSAATGTYYALLFTLAQYLQQGLGDSAVVSGLTLVLWVAAFGIAGQIVRRLPASPFVRAPRRAACCSPLPTWRSVPLSSPATMARRCSSCC